VKGKNPLDIQQKGFTLAAVLRASCKWDCDNVYGGYSCGIGVAYHNYCSQRIFTTVTGSPATTGSFWMVTNCEPGLSSKYGDMLSQLQEV